MYDDMNTAIILCLRECDTSRQIHSVDLFQGTHIGSSAKVKAKVVVPNSFHDLLQWNDKVGPLEEVQRVQSAVNPGSRNPRC